MPQPLSTWVDTPTKRKILEFVASVTDRDGDGFVPQDARIATFDNDGTLWCEKPMAQGVFVAQRLASMAEADPSLRQTQPWKAVSAGNSSWVDDAVIKHYHGDDADLNTLLAAVLKGFGDISVEDFEAQAAEFYDTALHPIYQQPYQKLGYVPMLELLDHLKSNGFACYIVSGGGREFMRPATQSMYGIPPERVIGSSAELAFKVDDQGANVVRSAGSGIIEDGPRKPIQIWERIGRRPILATGNANGDIPMLQFAADQESPTLCLLLQHDDAERELSYTSGAERAVTTAATEGWTVVSMKNDWKSIFSFQ